MTIQEFETQWRAKQSKAPRTQEGHWRKHYGPDWPGCFNSGTRPTLMHLNDRGHLWFVGPEMAVNDQWLTLACSKARSTGEGLRKVTKFKTKESAIKAWLLLVERNLNAYREQQADHAEAQRLQATGNPDDLLRAVELSQKWS